MTDQKVTGEIPTGRIPRYRPPLPYVNRNGSYHYFRRDGLRIRLPGLPFSPEYLAAYNAAYVRVFNRPPPAPVLPLPLPPMRPLRPFRAGKKYVYVIGDRDNGPVKIGVSANVRARLRDLQVANHVKLKVLAKFCGDEEQEAAAHRLLADDHISGEWFHRSNAVCDFIAHIVRGMAIDDFENEWDEVLLPR